MRDFTFDIYSKLLHEFIRKNYQFQTFENFLTDPLKRVVVLRHDVDSRNKNSLQFAFLENAFGICGTYYFRILPTSYDPIIIELILKMGHEIGYHYEDIAIAKGDIKIAIDLFKCHLAEFRKLYPVKTICMHGSPLSKHDNRDLWKHYNYRDFGIIGEPYFDMNFDEVFYLTDTGRTWNNKGISIRDKVNTKLKLTFTSTSDIIKNIDSLPDKVMLNFHPQRWNDNWLPWLTELFFQNSKNLIKRYLILRNGPK
jgi:hypothetical protein